MSHRQLATGNTHQARFAFTIQPANVGAAPVPPGSPRAHTVLERRHFSRNPKWGPSDFGCKQWGDGHYLRRPAFVPARTPLGTYAPSLPYAPPANLLHFRVRLHLPATTLGRDGNDRRPPVLASPALPVAHALPYSNAPHNVFSGLIPQGLTTTPVESV